MTTVAEDCFVYFTEQELDDLLTYLRTLPEQPADHDAAWRRLRQRHSLLVDVRFAGGEWRADLQRSCYWKTPGLVMNKYAPLAAT